MRGRKNHGVRRARWLKMVAKRKRRRRRREHAKRLSWFFAKHYPRTPYLHGPIAYRAFRLMLPLHHYEMHPRRLTQTEPGIRNGHYTFVGGGGRNFHVHVVLFPHVTKPKYIRFFNSGRVVRQVTHVPRRFHKSTPREIQIACAFGWFAATVRAIGKDIGWPNWDPHHRLPHQTIWGIDDFPQ